MPSGLTLPVYRRVAAEATADELLLHLPDVGRVWVRDGRTITVDWDGPPRPAALAATLEAAVWSAVLQQRGRLVLRGAAVDLGTGAVLLVGPSGSGTSTLAAALAVHHDAVVLADTVVPVGVVDGRPVIWIGPPGVELWPRSAAALGLPVGPHATVAGSVARVALGRRLAEPTETRAVTTMCLLDANHPHSTAATLIPVTGTDRFVAVSEAELRPERAAVFTGGRVARFDVAATLAAAATLWQVRRRWYPWSVESVAAIVAAAAR